jgi:murein DD-endopeptidase MepM/ murein hydrolase activator NlpD
VGATGAGGQSTAEDEEILTYEAHFRQRLVTVGQTVKAGDVIGYSGLIGSSSGAPHLHISTHRVTNTMGPAVSDGYYKIDFSVPPPPRFARGDGVSANDPYGWLPVPNFTPKLDPLVGQPDPMDSTRTQIIGPWNILLWSSGAQTPPIPESNCP